jgi:hypothetical protein
MANKPALNAIRKSFDKKLQRAADLFSAVYVFAEGTWDAINGWEALYPGQARRVVALSFLQVVISWEDFIESCFVRYLMGATSPSGFAPQLRLGPASSISHAYQLASCDPKFRVGSHYMTWSSWSDVVDRAQLFFQAGAPFSTLTHLQRDRLTDAIRIRNRIAHSSTKVRNDFNEVARRHLGLAPDKKLSQGYDVGQLLLDKSTKCFAKGLKQATYFEHYAHLFYEMADHICPALTEANGA